jgi:hypothetical protein
MTKGSNRRPAGTNFNNRKRNCNNCGFPLTASRYLSQDDLVISFVCGKCRQSGEVVYKDFVSRGINEWEHRDKIRNIMSLPTI